MRDQAEILRRWAREATPSGFPRDTGRVVCVVSGKGGVGKSVLSAGFALACRRFGMRTVLVDGDFGLANDDILLGLKPERTMYDVFAGYASLEEILVPGPGGIEVAPGASGVEALSGLSSYEVMRMAEEIRALAVSREMVVVDASGGVGEAVLTLAAAADGVVVVTTEDPTAMTDGYAVIKRLYLSEAWNRAKPVTVVVNMASSAGSGAAVGARMIRVAQKFLPGINVTNAGWIPFDNSVRVASRMGRPFAIAFPRSRAARAVERVSAAVVQAMDGGGVLRRVGS